MSLNSRYKNRFTEFFSDQNIMNYWLKVEKAVLQAQADRTPDDPDMQKAARLLDRIDNVDVELAREFEKTTKHDLNAFVEAVREQMDKAAKTEDEKNLGRYVHQSITSYDIEDTAQSLMLFEAGKMLVPSLSALADSAGRLAQMLKYAPANGYTHNQIATPVTIGKRFLDFEAILREHISDFRKEVDRINLAKIKGAVGVYDGELSPGFEQDVARLLNNMEISATATQILPIVNLSRFFAPIQSIAIDVQNMTQNLRLLSGPGKCEIMEGFAQGQIGSSIMTFKDNPINIENSTGFSRKVLAEISELANAAATWLERDISNSCQVQRHIVPETFEAAEHIAVKMTNVHDNMQVLPIQALRNIAKQGNYIYSGNAKAVLARAMRHEPGKEIYKKLQALSKEAKQSANFMDKPVDMMEKLAPLVKTNIDAGASGDEIIMELEKALSLPYNLRHIRSLYDMAENHIAEITDGRDAMFAFGDAPLENRFEDELDDANAKSDDDDNRIEIGNHTRLINYMIDGGQLELFNRRDSERWIETYRGIAIANGAEDDPDEAADLTHAVVKFNRALADSLQHNLDFGR